jgi:uncharacterized protein with ParB-like and HNH nuclease domain
MPKIKLGGTMDNKYTLSTLFNDKIFRIPDYQRGYSWENAQLKDFVEDIDSLIDDSIKNHYTGTIVIYQSDNCPKKKYGVRDLNIVDVIDGQQRLTTCALYLSIILRKLIDNGLNEYSECEKDFLYSGSETKLQLNNNTSNFYYDLITNNGIVNVDANNIHQKKLLDAYNYLKNHILEQIKSRNEKEYLQNIFNVIIGKLNFSFYTIKFESEIGMTFELMNSRGKELTNMELLKNYLLYWVYRNINENEKEDYTKLINKTWQEVYSNISNCNGDEDKCLRIAWILCIDSIPKSWEGYTGFKSNKNAIPLRKNPEKTEEVKLFLKEIVETLSQI